ncbi:MAG: metal ABC transporter ATP-binding protein [Solirubrobacteraceae bacterium]|nr:metal ABC transporter ATP-binding protein [Solirubrobacteraceae bacterium]
MRDRGLSGAVLADADDVSARYPGAGVPALASLTFAVRAGERVAVLGPNGGGKTTLFRLLTGELPAAGGRLEVPAGRVAIVPQTDRSRLDYPVSALDVALMGAVSRTRWWRRPARADRALARTSLERVGLGDLARVTFGDLSGGQRQRVLVARALVQDAPLLLLDEPFSGLDAPSAERLERLLAELAGEGRGLLMATHDLEQARAADLVLCVNRVQVAFGPPAAALTREEIERTYGAALVPLDDDGPALLPPHHHDHA